MIDITGCFQFNPWKRLHCGMICPSYHESAVYIDIGIFRSFESFAGELLLHIHENIIHTNTDTCEERHRIGHGPNKLCLRISTFKWCPMLYCNICWGILTHWGRNNMAVSSKTMFINLFHLVHIVVFWFKQWSLFPRFQMIISQHWVR